MIIHQQIIHTTYAVLLEMRERLAGKFREFWHVYNRETRCVDVCGLCVHTWRNMQTRGTYRPNDKRKVGVGKKEGKKRSKKERQSRRRRERKDRRIRELRYENNEKDEEGKRRREKRENKSKVYRTWFLSKRRKWCTNTCHKIIRLQGTSFSTKQQLQNTSKPKFPDFHIVLHLFITPFSLPHYSYPTRLESV